MTQERKYPLVGQGRQQLPPRAMERELPDAALLREIEEARGNPDREDWLAKLQAEAERRGIL